MRDHQPITIVDFLGTFSRGEDEVVPQGYFRDSQNIKFTNQGVKTRDGSRISIAIDSLRRAAIYKRTGETQRVLILDNSGNLFDSTNLTSPILSIPAMVDFSMVSIFNRAYITPHNGLTGLQNEKVYVYDGTGVARAAAGSAPSGTPIVLSEPNAGDIEAGDRVYAVCFLKASGYLTAPGCFAHIVGAGTKTIGIDNIPVGDSSTIARVIIGTKAITSYDGVFEDQTYYELPNATILDNVTTSIELNFLDNELLNDVSFLLEQLSEIPAGVGIGLYRGRMITWGEFDFPAILRGSLGAEPESFNAVDGFLTVNPGDSDEGVRNATEYRDQLIMAKSRRSYTTQEAGDPISAWNVIPIDKSNGTECHGFGRVLDFGEDMEDTIFVADRGGLRLFNGSYSDMPLSHNIQDIWNRINGESFHTTEMVIDPTNDQIYVCVPLDTATRPNAVLHANFQEGLDKIKWTTWTFPDDPLTIIIDVVRGKPVFKYGTSAGNLYEMNDAVRRDYGNPIENFIQFALLPQNDEAVTNHFTGARARMKGRGKILVTVEGLNGSNPTVGQNIVLEEAAASSPTTLFDFTGEACSVKFRMVRRDEFFTLTKFILYYTPIWDTNG